MEPRSFRKFAIALKFQIRAVWGLYEVPFYYGIQDQFLSPEEQIGFLIPMLIVLLFLIAEVGPFLAALDWSFMTIFILKELNSDL